MENKLIKNFVTQKKQEKAVVEKIEEIMTKLAMALDKVVTDNAYRFEGMILQASKKEVEEFLECDSDLILPIDKEFCKEVYENKERFSPVFEDMKEAKRMIDLLDEEVIESNDILEIIKVAVKL